MEGRKWFVLSEDQVRGPFEKEQIPAEITKVHSPLIWGRGLSDWLTPEQWNKVIVDYQANADRARAANERQWMVRYRGQELQPMHYAQMIEYLRSIPDHAEVLIWTEGYPEWKEIYQIHKILDDLGVSRRRHPRVPIMGQVEFESPNGGFNGRALSISEGGLGVTDTPPVRIGDKFKVVIKSPNLFSQLHASAEVVFAGSDGYCGLKFSGLPMESKSAIIEYVKRFTEGQVRTGTGTGTATNIA